MNTRILYLLLLILSLSACKHKRDPEPVTTVPVIEGNTEVRFEEYEKMILSSSVSNNGGSPITNYGHLYSATNPDPRKGTTGGVGVAGVPNATYTSTITNFSLNKTYYVRAFADNATGTGYGKVVQVRTPSVMYSMRFTFVTGADDKGGMPIGATIYYDDGSASGEGLRVPAFSPRSTNSATVVLTKTNFRRGQIKGVELNHWGIDLGLFLSYNNWDLDGMKVELLDDTGKSWVLYNKLNAGGLHRFTEQQQKKYFSFN